MVGCRSHSEAERMRIKKEYDQSRTISAPDLVNPLSMSPRVGVNPNQKYQEVMKFSASYFESSPGRKKRIPNFLQGKMSEAVKDSERKAIKDIEIYIESGAVMLLYFGGGSYVLRINGSVIETQ